MFADTFYPLSPPNPDPIPPPTPAQYAYFANALYPLRYHSFNVESGPCRPLVQHHPTPELKYSTTMPGKKRKALSMQTQPKQSRVRRSRITDLPTLEDVNTALVPQTRLISSKQYSSDSTGFTSSKVKVRLPPTSLEEGLPPPRVLFTKDELGVSSIPEWPINDDELAGQVDSDALSDVWMVEELANQKVSKSKVPEDSMKAWSEEIDNFLDEFIRLEGRGNYRAQERCLECREGAPEYRCIDCFTGELSCASCIVNIHQRNPFHRVEKWCHPGFFEPKTLRELGLHIQLGHPVGEVCLAPIPASDFTILDTHSIHEVSLNFCGCETATNHVKQLLRARFYPATMKHPRTAATFNLLKRYELLSFESKCSAYQYYRSIARERDNTGLCDTRERYREFLRMTRCWSAIKIFKRAGRGHDCIGVRGTELGECAVLCPACPQPGINLPDNWREAADNQKWIYALFLAIDANFRLRRKRVSNEEKDPAIIQGYGYFVKTKPYMEHLTKHALEKQALSQCVSHDAVNSADSRDSQGCAATGCGAVDCARHEFRRPNSIGDLQKGERYLNMDYLFHSSLVNQSYKRLVVSYDIACQWSSKFSERMSHKFAPDWFVNNGDADIMFLVPKFHLPAHIDKCHREYSFNLTKGVGRTDGEAVERGWARINDLATSTREMGPGARQDKLESHMGDTNWKKTIKMGQTLLAKYRNAVSSRSDQLDQLVQMEKELEVEWIEEWRDDVEAWENDRTRTNPYEPRVQDMRQVDVRLMLAEQDAAKKQDDDSHPSSVTASGMLILGLELEEAQRRLREDIGATGLHPTVLQQAKLQERCNSIGRRLDAWCHVQAYFTPGVVLLRTLDAQRASPTASEPKVCDRKLYLPSEIISHMDHVKSKAATYMDPSLLEKEWVLREAQAKDALVSLRSHLRVDSYLIKHKQDHVRGVSQNTRSQVLIKQNLARVKMAVVKYRKAYEALATLESPLGRDTSWRNVLRVLEDRDITGLPVAGIGEGTRQLSWIWLAPGSAEAGDGENGDKVQDVLRIQWLRARARVNRWTEENFLLLEEMRRVLAFLKHDAEKWGQRSHARPGVSPELGEGLAAYAFHQSHIRMGLERSFSSNWTRVTHEVEKGISDKAGRMAGGMEKV